MYSIASRIYYSYFIHQHHYYVYIYLWISPSTKNLTALPPSSATPTGEQLEPPVLVGAREIYEPTELIRIGCQLQQPFHPDHRPDLQWFLEGSKVSHTRLFWIFLCNTLRFIAEGGGTLRFVTVGGDTWTGLMFFGDLWWCDSIWWHSNEVDRLALEDFMFLGGTWGFIFRWHLKAQ